MDVVIEFVVQLLVQLVVEVIGQLLVETAFHGVASALRSRVGRYVLGALAGFGFGLAWGDHLSGHPTWPKLLWVSLGLAATAFVLAVGRGSEAGREMPTSPWAVVTTPPWHWSADRFFGFVVLNLALALGIAVGFSPGTG